MKGDWRLIYKYERKKVIANGCFFIVKNEQMSTSLTRTNSLRRAVRPIYDIDEEDDDARRDSSGRKRVPVVECLLDTSADEAEDTNIDIAKTNHILWLTFDEICHIRYVLTRTNLSLDKQYTQICRGDLCYRCRKKLNEFFLLSLFRYNTKRESCFICKQITCQKCLYPNFHPPALKLSIPIRIQTLLKPPVVTIDNNKKQKIEKTNTQTKTICYDCLQVNIKYFGCIYRKIFFFRYLTYI